MKIFKQSGGVMAKTHEISKCVIGEGAVFEGKFFVKSSIEIEGKFQGEIRTDNLVTIGETGKVKTDIHARKVIVAGTLIGNIVATEEVVLLRTGKIKGNIITPKVDIEPGVVMEGEVTITSDSGNNVTSVIETSFGQDADAFFKSLEVRNVPEGERADVN